MSQYPSVPPPGAYPPTNQSTPAPQSQYGYQQPQPQPQANASYGSYGSAPSSNKTSSNAFGQAFNQAVKEGKPMLNKLGKTISSKLGNKSSSPTTPQHLQSYQTYHQHHQHQQQQQQQYPPQSHQLQGQHGQTSPQPQQPNPHFAPHQQSFQQPGHPGNTYLPQQSSIPPSHIATPPPNPPQSNIGYNPNIYGQNGGQAQGQSLQGHFNHGPQQQQHHTPFQQNQAGPSSEQESGVIGNTQAPSHYSSPPPPPSNQQQQQSWNAHPSQPATTSPTPAPTHHQQPYSPVSQAPVEQQQAYNQVPQAHIDQQQTYNQAPQTPHQQPYSQAPPAPEHQQSWSQPYNQPPQALAPTPPLPYHAAPPVPTQPTQQQAPWNPTSPVSQAAPVQSPIPPAVSPAVSNPPTPAPPPVAPQAAHQATPPPTGFVAELPAEFANLGLMEGSQGKSHDTAPAAYQAYRPAGTQSQSPGQRFSIPRRAVSTSSVPIADPWRLADAATEQPTREFYMIADLVYDAMDRKFEPRGTGLLEASKMLESWKVLGLAEDTAQIFAHNSYQAFGKLWSVEGIPHVMVPREASLRPLWNFQAQVDSEAIKVPGGMVLGRDTVSEPTYMAAINRAGFYKYFFMEMMHEPDRLDDMVIKLCSETYNPSAYHQPDLQKRDRSSVLHGVAAQAATIRSACMSLVTQEIKATMQQHLQPADPRQVYSGGQAQAAVASGGPAQQQQQQQQAVQPGASAGAGHGGNAGNAGTADAGGQASGGNMTADEEMAVRMHSLRMQQQFNHMMAMTMVGGIGAPHYSSLV